MATRSEENIKDIELIEIEDGTEEPVNDYDASPEEESTGVENSGEEKGENSVKEEDNEEDGDLCSQRWQIAKVGILDVSLYSADVVTDGVVVATHISNCHEVWAMITAVLMLLPARVS